VSDADVVLMAMPGSAIAEAIGKLAGIDGKMVIDATNLYGAVPPAGFPSNAEFVKSKTNGPTAKSFNVNFASLYPRFAEARARPGNLWCGDAETREVVEQLNRDAGYDPVYAGPIENAALQEGMVKIVFAISEGHGPIRLPDGATRATLTPRLPPPGPGGHRLREPLEPSKVPTRRWCRGLQ
jgi:8-hydroxy-5-deazaflavin:NADPH oxidoreductase